MLEWHKTQQYALVVHTHTVVAASARWAACRRRHAYFQALVYCQSLVCFQGCSCHQTSFCCRAHDGPGPPHARCRGDRRRWPDWGCCCCAGCCCAEHRCQQVALPSGYTSRHKIANTEPPAGNGRPQTSCPGWTGFHGLGLHAIPGAPAARSCMWTLQYSAARNCLAIARGMRWECTQLGAVGHEDELRMHFFRHTVPHEATSLADRKPSRLQQHGLYSSCSCYVANWNRVVPRSIQGCISRYRNRAVASMLLVLRRLATSQQQNRSCSNYVREGISSNDFLRARPNMCSQLGTRSSRHLGKHE